MVYGSNAPNMYNLFDPPKLNHINRYVMTCIYPEIMKTNFISQFYYFKQPQKLKQKVQSGVQSSNDALCFEAYSKFSLADNNAGINKACLKQINIDFIMCCIGCLTVNKFRQILFGVRIRYSRENHYGT